MLERYRAWSGALLVLVVTVALVILDISDGSARAWWSRHSFTASVVAGVLVLLLTVLIVDRVNRMRQLKDRSLAVAAQAAVIVAQADRAAGAITRCSPASRASDEDRDEASQAVRTYTQMLLTSAPVLIEAKMSRRFLEAAQRVAAQLFLALRDSGDGAATQRDGGDGAATESHARAGNALEQLHRAATPLLEPLGRDRRAVIGADETVGSAEVDPPGS